MSSVTVPGTAASSTISGTFGNSHSLQLAQQISNAIGAAIQAGNFTKTVVTTPGEIVPPPPTNKGGVAGIDELIIGAGAAGAYTIPAAAAGNPEYLVVLNNTAPVTITGTPNTTVFGGAGTATIIDPTVITVSEQNGDASVTLTAADTGAMVAGNNHNDTLTAAGSGQTVIGGTGSNLLVATGNNDSISANGTNDTIRTGAGDVSMVVNGVGDTLFGGSGNTTVMGAGKGATYFLGTGAVQEFVNQGGSGMVFAGPGAPTVFGSFGASPGSDQVFGGSGGLTVATGGSNDTVYAGSGSTTVFGAFGGTVGNNIIYSGSGILEVATGSSNDTVYGGTSAGQTVFGGFDSISASNGNSVIYGGPNGMVIDPAGSSDTIYAGSGNDTLWFGNGAIAGNNLVYGGSGNLRAQFVGGAGSATVIGGAGNSTVFGNAGSNINFVGAQGNVTMIALGPLGAANGETLNAGGSTTGNLLEAVSGSNSVVGGSGDDTLVGGVTDNSTITGATTMTGGGGNNLFFFQHGNVNGNDIITDFTASPGNVLAMAGYDSLVGGGPQSAAQAALAGATTVGGNTTITLADGTRITFDNATTAQLQGHIFSS